jgi:hypothetical protein
VLKLQQLVQSDETPGIAQMKIIESNNMPKDNTEDMVVLVFYKLK